MNLAGNIVTTFSARLVMLALALVSSVLLARCLGPDGRGVFALVLLLPEWMKALGLLGFDQANAVVYAGLGPRERRALVWQSVVTAGVGGGILAVAGAAYLGLHLPGSQTVLRGPLWLYLIALSTVPVRLFVDFAQGILRGANRILLLNTIDAGAKVTSVALLVVLVAVLRLDVAGAVWADTLISIGGLLLVVALLRRFRLWGRPVLERALWVRTARFALPTHGAMLAGYVNYRIDEVMIAVLLPPEQLGFYVIAVGLVERLWILPGAVGTALVPHLTNSPQRDPRLAALIARNVMVWVGAACLVVALGAEVAVRILYTSAFEPVVAPLRWLLPGIFTLSVGKVLVAELLARERPYYTVGAGLVAAVVNIVGNLVLIPRLGISGAAIASSLSYSSLSAVIVFYYLRETGVPWTALLPGREDVAAYASLTIRPWQRACARWRAPARTSL